jgi:hypothetical protein
LSCDVPPRTAGRTAPGLESVEVGGEFIDLPYDWGEEFGINLGSGYRARVA